MIKVEEFNSDVVTLTDSDESTVRNLFTRQSMNFAGFELCYDRGDRFMSLLRLQAPTFQTYLAKQGADLRSVISLSSGPRWVHMNGVKTVQDVAWVSDFRIDGSRYSRRFWRFWLGTVFALYREEFSSQAPQYFLASVLKGNQTALKNFTAGRRDKAFELTEIGNLQMVNILAVWKKFKRTIGYQAQTATAVDQNELLEFLKTCEQKKQVGCVIDTPNYCEIRRRMAEWKWEWDQFILVKNKDGKIVGCALPWSPPSHVKKMYFTKAPKILSWLLTGMKTLGFRVPAQREPIRTLYLTHLNIDPGEPVDVILASILNYVFENRLNRGYQMVSFPDWWQISKTSDILKCTLNQITDVGIYSIAIENALELKSDGTKIFGFEMAVI